MSAKEKLTFAQPAPQMQTKKRDAEERSPRC